ncbi:MAG: hypothetical protein KL801_18565 [Mesorhizobium sp.]|nr:hypothetical protein [Mesorhizobium sp.]
MISQMNAVHEGARLAMGDHRAADPLLRRRRQPAASLQQRLLTTIAAILLVGVLAALVFA